MSRKNIGCPKCQGSIEIDINAWGSRLEVSVNDGSITGSASYGGDLDEENFEITCQKCYGETVANITIRKASKW